MVRRTFPRCVLNSNKRVQESPARTGRSGPVRGAADYIWHLYDIGLRVGFGASLSRSGDFVGTPPQIRGGGARDQQSILPFGHPLVSIGLPQPYRALPASGRRCPLGTLWSAALWAPYGLSEFKFYDEIFYLDYKHRGRSRKKRVAEIVHELLTPRALAYWFMDDGNALSINQKRYYLFSTQSFPKGARRAIQALSHNFGVVGLRP